MRVLLALQNVLEQHEHHLAAVQLRHGVRRAAMLAAALGRAQQVHPPGAIPVNGVQAVALLVRCWGVLRLLGLWPSEHACWPRMRVLGVHIL